MVLIGYVAVVQMEHTSPMVIAVTITFIGIQMPKDALESTNYTLICVCVWEMMEIVLSVLLVVTNK